MWLVEQLWLWMAVAAALGAALTVGMSVGAVKVERWGDIAHPSPATPTGQSSGSGEEALAGTPAETSTSAACSSSEHTAADASGQGITADPFPAYRGPEGERPWELEELWSRPARVVTSSADDPSTDEWDLAAQEWRHLADERTGRSSTHRGEHGTALLGAPAAATGAPDSASPGTPVVPSGAPAEAEAVVPRGVPAGGFGPGSMPALPDGGAPAGYTIKGIEDTRAYHTLDSRSYSRIVADVYFNSEESALAAGFTRWDRCDSAALQHGDAR